jgi:hypothetical protein
MAELEHFVTVAEGHPPQDIFPAVLYAMIHSKAISLDSRQERRVADLMGRIERASSLRRLEGM